MAPRRASILPLVVGVLAGGAVAVGVVWWLNLRGLDGQIRDKQRALTKLLLSGRIPPNQQVMDYLQSREEAVERRYDHWFKMVTSPPLAEAASADPQLFFQEQFHHVQRGLERVAAARSMEVPELLGVPEDLPPSDTVPRLLVQLTLVQEAAALIVEQRVQKLMSLKVEDPETVPGREGEGVFLIRLPVRIRLQSTLAQLMQVLGALQRVEPVIDTRALRLLRTEAEDVLEVELLIARNLVAASQPGLVPTVAAPEERARRGVRPPRPGDARDEAPARTLPSAAPERLSE